MLYVVRNGGIEGICVLRDEGIEVICVFRNEGIGGFGYTGWRNIVEWKVNVL